MSYQLKLEAFEGPLDLLLHLIAKAKVRIEDVSIADITVQYLAYLSAMERFDIEIASDFLVMAATLLHIKSSFLLPKVKPEAEEEEGDPRQELIMRLLEYKRYKEAGEGLKVREGAFSGVYSKLPEEIHTLTEPLSFELKADIQGLYQAFLLLSSRKAIPIRPVHVHQIARDPVSLSQRIHYLATLLKENGETTFFTLLSPLTLRGDIVLTFLALLEMLKENVIELHQTALFDDIIIKRRLHHG